VLCVEAKARGKKRKPEQLAWAMLMEMVGHKVHLCYSMEEFMAALREEMQ